MIIIIESLGLCRCVLHYSYMCNHIYLCCAAEQNF